MLKKITFFENKINLIVQVLENKIIIKEIINIDDNEYNIIICNDKQLEINDEIYFENNYNFKIINLFSKNQKDSVGIINSFSKKDLLIYINNNKYYDLKIILNNKKNILIDNKKLYTIFFNENPLFYKFKINIKNFDEKKLKIFSEDSKFEKFNYNDFITEQYIYFSPEINKKYFYQYEDKIDEINYFNLNKNTNYLNLLNKNNKINKFIKWFEIINDIEKEIELEITYNDDSKDLIKIKTTNKINKFKSDNSICINNLVKEIKINNYIPNLKINIFNEDYFLIKNDNVYLNKNKNTDYIFQSNEIKHIDFEQILNLNELKFNKKYIILNNILIENNDYGYLKLRKIETNDLLNFNFNLFIKNINNLKTDYYDIEIDEYFKNNFKNNKQYFKGDINV